MAINKFEVTISGVNAFINTPFPVCQNVWADFVLKIFPDFLVPPEHASPNRYNGKHINRTSRYDEIADGQGGIYYRHAYLPHGDRYWSGWISQEGRIHVPDCRTFYLEQIQADLEENPSSRSALLNSVRQVHAETIGYLLNHLRKLSAYRDVKTTKELRDVFGKELVMRGLLDGCYNDPGKEFIEDYAIDKIPLGQLPLSMKGRNIDFLSGQTCLDFLRVLDEVLGINRDLDRTAYLLQIPGIMNQKYSDIIKVQ